MSDFRFPQNPGIGGLDELTSTEEAVIQATASLTGNAGKLLRVNNAETAVAWVTLAVEVPTGAIDNSNTSFTLTATPLQVLLYVINGAGQSTPADYSISGTTITTINPVGTSGSHFIIYLK